MKTCPHCGAENPDDYSQFCSKCWGELKSSSASSPQTQNVPDVEDAGVQPGYETQTPSQALQKPSDIAPRKNEEIDELAKHLHARIEESVKREEPRSSGEPQRTSVPPSLSAHPPDAETKADIPFTGKTAGFGDRFKAYTLDMFILIFLGMFAGIFLRAPFGFFFGMNFLFFAGQIFYHVYFIGTTGQTPGKMFMGLRVVNEDGSPGAIGFERAFLRWVGYTINTVFFSIGWLMVAVDERHQGLHDKIARTVVVYVK